ncbi:MAG: hypothetical protein ACI9W2_004284 [Gammaproteobacteria bacterium]|jgi:hypothetical protein
MRGGVTVFLLLVAGVLGAVVALELRHGTLEFFYATDGLAVSANQEAVSPARTSRAALAVDEGLAGQAPAPKLPALALMTDTRERPLFFEARRYPEPAVVGESPMTPVLAMEQTRQRPLGPIALSAIIITDDERVAIFRDASENGTNRMQIGEEINGWTLVELMPQAAVFAQGSTRENVQLRSYDAAPTPSARRENAARNGGGTVNRNRVRNPTRNTGSASRRVGDSARSAAQATRQAADALKRARERAQRGRLNASIGRSDRTPSGRPRALQPIAPRATAPPVQATSDTCGLSRC